MSILYVISQNNDLKCFTLHIFLGHPELVVSVGVQVADVSHGHHRDDLKC